jgi:hypothetical protein
MSMCRCAKCLLLLVSTTGRLLSKVLPSPNKGSRSCFLNVPQLRDISKLNKFNVHKPGTFLVQAVFSLFTASLGAFNFPLVICNLINSKWSSCDESWKWFPLLFFLVRNAHMLFDFSFCITYLYIHNCVHIIFKIWYITIILSYFLLCAVH